MSGAVRGGQGCIALGGTATVAGNQFVAEAQVELKRRACLDIQAAYIGLRQGKPV